MQAVQHESAVDLTAEPAEDVEARDDLDHFTCCDPAYYLAIDRPVYTMCGQQFVQGDAIKLDIDDTPLCRLCVSRAQSLGEGESPCERLCPRLLFG